MEIIRKVLKGLNSMFRM